MHPLQNRLVSTVFCAAHVLASGDVQQHSAALQVQLAAARAAAAASAPLQLQQHTELLAKQQHAQALKQLAVSAGAQVSGIKVTKLQIEAVQDEIEDLEYALKKARKNDRTKVPGLETKLAAAEQRLAALQQQLTATQQHLEDGQLQAWYPDVV